MFGMSVFQSVLERLKTEEAEEETAETEISAASCAPSFAFVAGGADRASAARSAVERAYFDASFVEPPPVEPMPEFLNRISLAEVAEELALGERETLATLAAKRRSFAATNHPDRLPQDYRTNATVRMKLANMLIDEASRQLQAA
ncbi:MULTISPECIES: hypothetical protein [unclassified Ensifer]|uniref:hypothetical protein n=1 Tax=unclassified Ensifer TaxID=2633371 RepID=UPI000812C447|nr:MULTISPECIES: hypothetical protein [unclassified Ensifer]OCP23033.1 hypothetical protein BC363_26035 [Ensifer sp. LC384]OCP23650.1 hypothetical protein BC361_21260 [Ensifer sp. LC54]